MNKQSEPELEQIIKGCARNYRNSQNELYKLYYSYAMSVSIRYVKNETDAITVTNDSFLKVFRYIKKYDTDKPFKPWFRKILVNTALTHIKKQNKIKTVENIEDVKGVTGREDILSRIGYKELLVMVQSLSTAYKTVFNMYIIDGFKHREIAQKLGITEATSKSNLTRARAKLKDLVNKEINS